MQNSTSHQTVAAKADPNNKFQPLPLSVLTENIDLGPLDSPRDDTDLEYSTNRSLKLNLVRIVVESNEQGRQCVTPKRKPPNKIKPNSPDNYSESIFD